MRWIAFGFLTAAAAGLIVDGAAANAATAIGKITRIQGDAQGTVEGVARGLAASDVVYLDEAVATGVNARLEITLDDQTMLTVGERASLKLDAFVYRPDTSVVKITVAGAFRFISGQVPSTAARDAAITAPFAVIAIRGTDVWGGPVDNQFGVFLFEGAVDVTNAGATTALTGPGQGTNIDPAGAGPPGAVTLWPQDKIARAVATVTFQ